MYTKITRSGGRQYLQLVEGCRNEQGKVRHRVVANLGRLEGLTPAKLDPLINGLNRAIGRSDNTAFPVEIESSKAYGNVFALHELWMDLGFDRALGRAMRSGRRKIQADALVRAMVFNRLCDPSSKLGCLRWIDTVAMPEMPAKVEHGRPGEAAFLEALVGHHQPAAVPEQDLQPTGALRAEYKDRSGEWILGERQAATRSVCQCPNFGE